MIKYLLLIAFLYLAWRFWRKHNEHRSNEDVPQARAPEQMLACLHCGVNIPVSDAVLFEGRAYCCKSHLSLGEGSGRE